MSFRYAILGSGMQGTAAAYDLARFGDAQEVVLLDSDADRATRAAERVNALIDRPIATAGVFDAESPADLARVLSGITAAMSCVPYFLNERVTRAAIAAGAHLNDLGGNTAVVERQLLLAPEARAAGVSVVPDCGVAPGMANTLAAAGIRSMDAPRHVHMYCGGLPQNRDLPLGYKKLFVLDGLTNEYFGKALALRDGKVQEIDTFAEVETVEFPAPIGALDGFTTSGGTSTCPRTYAGKLETYEYKTVRYPGHYKAMKMFKDLGFLDQSPITVKGHTVTPRDVFHEVMTKVWHAPHEKDLLVLRVVVDGERGGKPAQWSCEIIDRQDDRTGFSAMERTTAFPAAIVTAMQARKQVAPGAHPLELGVDPAIFLKELAKRDIPYVIQTR